MSLDLCLCSSSPSPQGDQDSFPHFEFSRCFILFGEVSLSRPFLFSLPHPSIYMASALFLDTSHRLSWKLIMFYVCALVPWWRWKTLRGFVFLGLSPDSFTCYRFDWWWWDGISGENQLQAIRTDSRSSPRVLRLPVNGDCVCERESSC